jgi:hypothetical protein
MNGETLDALTRSIAKWDANSKIENLNDAKLGAVNCPLCALFYAKGCEGCPVFSSTGETCCVGSPYKDAFMTFYGARKGNPDISIFRAAAAAERDFLMSLLPTIRPDPNGGTPC